MSDTRVTFSASAEMTGNTLSGFAHAFGQLTQVGNRYLRFAQSAFDQALSHSDVRAFLNHDTTLLLGRQSNGTVRLSVQPDGLAYEIDLPDTTYAADLKTLIARGDLSNMSFGIIPGAHTLSKAPDGKQIITHTSVKEIFDISPVSLPAFAGSTVSLHSLNGSAESIRSQIIKARHRAAKEFNK